MQVISDFSLNHRPYSWKQNTYPLKKYTECLSEYVINLFKDLSEAILKRLDCQSQRIKETEIKLKHILTQVQKQGPCALDLNQNYFKDNNQPHKDFKYKNIGFESIKVESINEALRKMENDILSLQISLTNAKKLRSVQDPQSVQVIESSIYSKQQNRKQQTETTISKIIDLGKKINQFAKQTSGGQSKGKGQKRKRFKFQKSRSLISISNRRYYQINSSKRDDYRFFLSKNEFSQYDRQYDRSDNSNMQNFSNLNCDSYIQVRSAQQIGENGLFKNDKNKMPLINRCKHSISQLLQNVKDQNDANVIKFYLKKTLKKLQEQYPSNNQNFSSQYDAAPSKYNINLKEQSHIKRGKIPQYFANRSNNIQKSAAYQNQNTISACSIAQNTDKITQAQYSMHMLGDVKSEKESTMLTRNQSRKTKYFQRTSNEHKMQSLNKKYKS